MSMKEPTNTTGYFGPYSRVGQSNPRAIGGYSGQPILCVNTWEHAYLRDYGVGGKRAYLERWWDRIDWEVVERSARMYGPESSRRLPRSQARIQSVLNHSFARAL